MSTVSEPSSDSVRKMTLQNLFITRIYMFITYIHIYVHMLCKSRRELKINLKERKRMNRNKEEGTIRGKNKIEKKTILVIIFCYHGKICCRKKFLS